MDKELANGSLDSLDSSTDNLEMASSTKPVDTYVPANTNSAYVEFRDKDAQNDNSNQLEPKKSFLKKISNRSTVIISAVILTIVLLISGISALLVTKNQGSDGSSKLVPSQNLDIESDSLSSESEIFSGKEKALLVNGDIITRGSLTVTNGSYIGVLKSEGLSSSQEYLLPNASGTICLNTNNCGFATADQLSSLQSQLGQIVIPSIPEIPASSLVNNQSGSVSIQGASNRISVSTNNGVISISTPQDIGLLSSPTFANLVLSGNFNLGGILDLPLNCSVNANGGALTTNASGQVICSDDDNTGGGSGTVSSPGGTAGYIPIFTAAQTIADSIISQALGVVSVGGDLSLSGDLTLGSLSNGFLSVNGSGLVSVNTIDLGIDTSGDYVLGVSAGNGLSIGGVAGEGWTPTVSLALQANKGLEVDGSGLSLIDCANGELLKYNGSNQWACAVDIDTDTTGSFTLAGTSGTPETINNGDTVTIAAGNNVTTTAGATDTVTIATVNNPNFSTSVTTPLLQSSGALSITPGGALTVGSTGQTALLQGTNVTITSNGAGNDIILTSADQIRFSGFDCSALANGGKLTTDASGNISCAADSGASGSTITGSGTANRIALYTGSQVIADSWLLQNGSTLELDNTRGLSLLGGNFSVTGTGLFSGLITANGGLTLGAAQSLTVNGDAFTDLTGTGLSISSGSLQTTLGTSVDLTNEVTGTLPVTSGGTGLASTPTNGQLLIGNGTGYSLATITQGAGITVTNGVGSITVASSLGGTIELGTETTGDYVANVTAGNGLTGSASGAGSTPTLALGQLTSDWNQTGAFDIVLNNAGSELRILESAGATFYGSLDVGDLTANRTYTLPDATGTICLDTGNCAGSGGGVTTAGGTNNTLAKFNGAQTIADSTITDDGSTVTTSVDLVVQGGSATIGTTLQDGALTLYSSGQSALIQASLGSSDRTYTLPDGDGEFCIKELGNCSGGSGGNAPTGAEYLTLSTDGTLTAERVLTFNGTNFSVTDGGANGSYTVNTIQNIATTSAPTFAGLTLNGNLNLGSNTLQGTTAVIDFTNFDVASNGNVTAGTYNGQTISSSASFTGTLTAAGLLTANGGVTLGAAQSLTVNGDAFTDLTGNGLQVSANTLTIATQANKGLEVDGNGLSLIDCANGEILKYNGSNQWACANDVDTDTTYTAGNGLDLTGTTFSVDSPTCAGTDKLTWNGTAFVCAADVDTDTGDEVAVNGAATSGANFIDTAASGTNVATTWSLDNLANPDEITLSLGAASGTDAGIITANAQTIGGSKTFNGQIVAGAGINLGAQTLQGTTAVIDFNNFDVSSAGAITAVGVNAGSGLIQGTGGITASGTITLSSLTNGFLEVNGSGVVSVGTIDLGTDTNGNYVATITPGNGISGTSNSEGGTPTIALSNLTSSWLQSGAFDITLDNASSELNIRGSGGAFYAVLDVAGITSDQTFTFNEGGTVVTSGNVSSHATTGVTAGAGLTGGGTTGVLTVDIGAGNGVTVNANDITLALQANKGLEVDGNGLSLIDCANGELLKYNGSNQWACSSDIDTDTGVTTVGAIDSQTKSANGAVISGTSIYLQTADISNPGLVSTGTQTFAGDKTFNNDVEIFGSSINLGNNALDTITATANLRAGNSATATTGTTSGTGTNTTTLTLTADAFALGDVVLIDNAGQDYYTRITADPGTGSYTVSPAVTFENARTVTKYNVQNVGATATDYSTLSDRFFQGYFLGGVVTGAGSTTLSDGRLHSTNALNLNASSLIVQNNADSTSALQIQNAAGTSNLLIADTTNTRLAVGQATANYTLDVNGDINVTTGNTYRINGVDLNTAGTLSNVAYQNQANTFTGLLTANGDLTLQTGDTFTMNGDAFTDLTGSGLTVSSNALTVDDSTATGFFRNGGNSFAGAATLGTNDANVLNLETNNTNRFQISSSISALTGQGNTYINSSGGILYLGNSSLANGISIGTGNANGNTINIGGASAVTPDATALSLQASATINLGTSGVSNTVQIGNYTGAVSQTINIGNNATASSTNNINIGSSIAGTTAIRGATTITNRTSGSADTLIVSNSTSTGNILQARDDATAVMTISDGGATLLQNSVNSTSAFQIQNVAGDQLLKIDTSTTENLITNGQFEANTTGWAAHGAAGSPSQSTSQHYLGNGSMQFTTTAAANDGVKYNYALASQTTYTMTMYVKNGTNTAAVSTISLGYSEDGSTDTDCATSQTISGAGWTKLTCTFTTANVSGTDYIYLKQSDATARTIYIDSAELQTASSLVINPDFETDISNWNSYGGPTTSHNTSESYTGSGSMQIDTNGFAASEGPSLTSFAGTITANTTYTASFWVKTDAATASAKTFNILKRFDSVDAGAGTSCGSKSVPIATWTNVTCTFTTGNTIPNGSFISLNVTDDGITPITFFVDTVNLAITKYNSNDIGRISLNAAIDSPLTVRGAQDSTSALQVQQLSGKTILSVDTLNGFVGIGTDAATKTLQVDGKALVRATSSDTDTFQVANSATIGAANSVIFNVAANSRAVSVGLGSNTLNTNLNVYGMQLINTKVNSTNALRVQDSSSQNVLTVSTATGNKTVTIGHGTGMDANLLVLNTNGGTSLEISTAGTGDFYSAADNVDFWSGDASQFLFSACGTDGNFAVGAASCGGVYRLDVFGGDVNVESGQTYRINGTDINAAGTLTNVAYLNGTGPQTFTGNNSFTGTILHQNASNSTAAFSVQNSIGTNLLTADTTNMRISIGSTGTPTGQLYVSGTSPTTNLGSITAGDGGGIVKIQGKYAYTIGYNDGQLHVIDISAPASPVIVGSVFAPASVYGLEVKGKYAYAIDPADGLVVFDVSNPFSPTVLAIVSVTALGGSGSYDEGFVINGNYLYMVDLGSFPTNFIIIDITNPSNPVVKSIDLPYVNGASMLKAKMQGNYMYIGDWSTGQLLIYNMSNPLNPALESSTSVSGGLTDLFPVGRYLYAVRDIGTDAIIAYDVSDPSSPTIAGSLGTGSYNPKGVHVQGRYAYVLFGSNRLGIYDISNPASITQVSLLSGGGLSAPYDFEVQGRYAYVTNASNDTFVTYDLGGAYVQQLEAGGVETSTLSVSNDTFIGGDLTLQGGLSVQGSSQFTGNVGVLGQARFQSVADSTTAFQIQNASGNQIINIDTTTNNLITNPSFEGTDTVWQNGSRTTAERYIGEYSYAVPTFGSSIYAWQEVPSLASNTTYKLTFYIKDGSGDYDTFSSMIAGYNEDGSDVNCMSSQTVSAFGWTRFSCTFTTTTVTSPNPYIYIGQSSSDSRIFYIDGVQLTAINEPTNLVTNPDFESGATDWSSYSTGSVTQSSAQAHQGTYSLRITTGTSTQAGATHTGYTSYTPDTQYTIKGYAKLDSASAPSQDLYAFGHTVDFGQSATSNVGCSRDILSSTEWKLFTCTFTTASSLRASPYITFTRFSGGTASSIVYLDSVQMYEGPDVGDNNPQFNQAKISLNGVIDSPAVFKGNSNSTTAFIIQGANAGHSLFAADTVNNRIAIGKNTASYTLDVEGTINATTSVISPLFTSAAGTALSVDSGTTAALNIGTGANAKTITIGNATGATSVVVNCGTGACSFGANATAHTTTVGSVSGAATTTIQGGTGGVNLGTGGIANTIQIGNITGAVTQSTNIGTNSTASSTNNINIGSSIAGTTAITGATTITNRTSGSADTLIVGNSTSTGNIFLARDNTTAVMTIANGGATTFQNQTNSTAGFQIQNAAGSSNLFIADTTNTRIGVGAAPANSLLSIGTNTTTAAGGVTFGTDTSLYRYAQDVLATDGSFFANGGNFFATTAFTGVSFSSATNSGIYNTGADGTGIIAIDNGTAGVPVVGIAQGGATTFRNNSDSTAAFQIQNSSSTPLLVADTTNSRLYVGNPSADSTGAILVLDTKNTSGDPTGVDGAMYYNSDSKSFRCYSNGSWRSCVGGVVFANTSLPGGNTVNSTAAETNFASNYTIPANECQPGRVYKITAQGVWGQDADATVQMKVKMGSTVIGQTNNNSTNAAGTETNRQWKVEYDIICQTAGASGTVEGQGILTAFYNDDITTSQWEMKNTAAVTIDTTTSQTLQMSIDWGTAHANNTFTLRQFIVEASGP